MYVDPPNVPRVALSRQEAAISLGMSLDSFERHVQPEELADFSECFLTGTAAEVTPVSEIGQWKFKPAQITETLLNDYHADVNREVSAINLNAA